MTLPFLGPSNVTDPRKDMLISKTRCFDKMIRKLSGSIWQCKTSLKLLWKLFTLTAHVKF